MQQQLRRLILYAFQLCIARPILFGLVGVRYRRRGTLPPGPCLVVANHNSHLDAAVLLAMFPLRRVHLAHPVAAADYFEANWFMRMWAMLFLNSVPIERKPARGVDPLKPLADRLQAGQSLIFFPEGSRGEAGVVAPFRPGVGMLLRAVPGLAVVPVYLSGPERIWPRGRIIPVPLSIDANVGKPRTYPADQDARALAERVRHDVLALAPPPRPVPGQRPRPPLRIAVCCPDEERRRELQRLLVERLDPAAAGPAVEVEAWPAVWWLRLLARLLVPGDRAARERLVALVERARLDETLGYARPARFLVGGGAALVDLLAGEVTAARRVPLDERGLDRLMQQLTGERPVPVSEWRSFLRRGTEVWLTHALRLARLRPPDVLALVPTSIPALEAQQESYREVAGSLRRRSRTQVIDLGEEPLPPEQAAERLADVCRSLAAPAAVGGA